jgi:tetratricopeptide (TPR) repeat protein
LTRCTGAWRARAAAALAVRSPALTALAAAALAILSLAGQAAAQTPDAVPDWSLQARQHLASPFGSNPDQALAERRRWLDEAERLLALGQAVPAQDALDRAAMMLHAADTEAALVRAYMQAGEYRRALAFGAHAAGAHRREWPASMALYAWLLQVGGQAVVARRMLDDALALAPEDTALQAARRQLDLPWPVPDAVLRQAPLRTAPYAWGAEPAENSAVVGSAVLLDDGVSAVLPTGLLSPSAPPNSPIWLRNGLGQTVRAQVQARDDALGMTTLRLDNPLPHASLAAAGCEPYAGSPGYMVEYAPSRSPSAAWPLLRQGFFARLANDASLRPLGLDAPAGPRGGPVFNRHGEFVGIAVQGADGGPRLVPAALLAARAGATLASPDATDSHRTGPADIDAIYERSLHIALQVIRLQ